MPEKSLKTPKILNIKISVTRPSEVLNFVKSSLRGRHKFFITTPNPEIIVEAQTNEKLREALGLADLSLPDGIGITIVSKFLSISGVKRIPGREMMFELLKLTNKNKYNKVFLLGSTPKCVSTSVHKIKKYYPNIKIYGDSGPRLDKNANPVSKVDIKLQSDVLDKINKIRPNLLFVAFGAPKQELWVQKHFKNLKVGGVMVVGGSLDYFAGLAKLPPKWLANLGLEWLWRLINEPKRVKRILNAVIIFPYLVLKEKCGF